MDDIFAQGINQRIRENGTNHIRYTREFNHDNREKWSLKDINIGNKLHKINGSFRDTYGSSNQERSLVDRDSNSIPHFKVYEFEPKSFRNFEQYIQVIRKQFANTISHVATLGNAALGKYWDKMNIMLESIINGKTIEDSAKSAFTENTPNNDGDSLFKDLVVSDHPILYNVKMFIEPIREYNEFFKGKYIREYELPYNENTYVFANGHAGWNNLNVSDINFGNTTLNTVFKTLSNLGVVDAPIIPNWVAGKDSSNYYVLSSNFNLLNDDLDSLIANFTFLSHLMQGTMWLQNNTYNMRPNIYSVELPGFLFIRYATMSISIKHLGNRRIIDNNVGNALQTRFDKFKNKSGFEMFNGKKLKEEVFFPDAWGVEIQLNSLVPNNYNTFMNYFQFGFNDGDKEKFSNTIINGQGIAQGKVYNPDEYDPKD